MIIDDFAYLLWLISESAETLESESGYSLESPEVAEFRRSVLEGDWTKVIGSLSEMGIPAQNLPVSYYA